MKPLLKICLLVFAIPIVINLQAQTPKVKPVIVIDNFDSYPNDEALLKAWYHPCYHGGPMVRTLEANIKDAGKYSLKCCYTNLDEPTKFYSPVCRVDHWDASGSDAVSFWYKSDGSGREFTIQFNIANKDGKNIHDLWETTYFPEKGDTSARTIILPYCDLKHNIQYADTPNVSPEFKPESICEIALYIGGRDHGAGTGAYYFDSIIAVKTK